MTVNFVVSNVFKKSTSVNLIPRFFKQFEHFGPSLTFKLPPSLKSLEWQVSNLRLFQNC